MKMQKYGASFTYENEANWIVNKLSSYGIEAYRHGSQVEYVTTPERHEILTYLFAWWTGIINEWWYRFDMLWHVNHRYFFPGACVEAMMYGTERPNIFAPNDEMKQMYRERHARRHGK